MSANSMHALMFPEVFALVVLGLMLVLLTLAHFSK